MSYERVKPSILKMMAKKIYQSEDIIERNINYLRVKYPEYSINAVAEIYARREGFSVYNKLLTADKVHFPEMLEKIKHIKKSTVVRKSTNKILNFPTSDYFIKKHVEEINRTYSNKCYTSTYILIRKVLENFIIHILQSKFPKERELYFDTIRLRYKDFSVVLKNLYTKRNDFDPGMNKVIELFYDKAVVIKNDMNNKAHSLFHIIESKKEIDKLNIPVIFELLKRIK